MTTKQNNPTRIYRTVSVEDRLPNRTGTGDYTVVFKDDSMSSDTDVYCDGVVGWLEEIDSNEKAREIILELFENFDILPTEKEISEELDHRKASFFDGIGFILNHIKGGGE